MAKNVQRLIFILGDQLDPHSPALKDIQRDRDLIWMAEVKGEATEVWSHKARIALFLSAMRHFHQGLKAQDYRSDYVKLEDPKNTHRLGGELARAIQKWRPKEILGVQPGEYRVQEELRGMAKKFQVPIHYLPDTHFIATLEEFQDHIRGKKRIRQEYFYRELRKKTQVLMKKNQPEGGQWNYDKENRGSFGKSGPQGIPPALGFHPDKITKAVLRLVEKSFPEHPGSLKDFDWPVTTEDAQAAYQGFLKHRFTNFGNYQDAMWTSEPFLYHSLLGSALNLKLLNPLEVIRQAKAYYQKKSVPLAAAEGFIRQILGWREFVRGIYWTHMPEYAERNFLEAQAPLPKFYWTGETEMNCLKETVGMTLQYGYSHHIQRLMVTGLFALLLGVAPKQVHEWYLAIYVDAVEWVELPNTLGMSQFADGGLLASKPYAASGNYIHRMSNFCQNCPYDPKKSEGEKACPFTTLYWDFLDRHRSRLKNNPRMALAYKNLNRKTKSEQSAFRKQAKKIFSDIP